MRLSMTQRAVVALMAVMTAAAATTAIADDSNEDWAIRPKLGAYIGRGVAFDSGDGINFERDVNHVGDPTPDEGFSGDPDLSYAVGVDLIHSFNDSWSAVLGFNLYKGEGTYNGTAIGSVNDTLLPGGDLSMSAAWTALDLTVGAEYDITLSDKLTLGIGGFVGYSMVLDGKLDYDADNKGELGGQSYRSQTTGTASFDSGAFIAGGYGVLDREIGDDNNQNLGLYVTAMAGEGDLDCSKLVTTSTKTIGSQTFPDLDGDGDISGGSFKHTAAGVFATYTYEF